MEDNNTKIDETNHDEQQRRKLQEYIFDLEEAQDKTEELSAAHRELKHSQDLLLSLLRGTIHGICLIRDRKFEWCNEAFGDILGWEQDELIGTTIEIIYPSLEEYEKIGKVIYGDPHRVGLIAYEYDFLHSDGHRVPCLVTGRALDQNDSAKGYVFSFTDITEQKRARESLNNAYKELEQRNADLMTATEALKNSEKQFRFITEKMADIVWTLDKDFKTTYVSPSIKSVLGFTPEERKLQAVEELMTPESLQRVQMMFLEELAKDDEATADSDRFNTIEIEYYHRDGSTVWLENRVKAIRDPSGSVIGFHGVSRDITERKRAEADRERLLSAIEQAAETIVITDAEGYIQYANPAFERITGYPREEVIGENPRILKSGEHDKSFYRQMWQTITAGDTWRGRIINRKKNGTFYTAEASISPVLDGAGEVVNFVSVKRDITDEIRMEEKLRQAQKMESIGTLAGGIAHDFNNILFPMVGYAEMLKIDLPADSPLHGHVDEILHAALRSKDLVKQILAFSRQGDQDIKPIKLQPIVKEATKLLRSSIPTIIDIQQDIDPDCGVVVADPTQIHQIVMNLATNAYHAMEDTGGRLNVNLKHVRLESGQSLLSKLVPGEYALLTVVDTGIGIEKDIMDKILDPYFTTKETGKGTGLGLSVVQGIVKSCNGDIRINSEPGKGTEIQVYLPIMDRKVGDIRTDRSEPIRGGTEKILLVDDEEAIIRMEQQMLERLGYIVNTRTGSVDALEAFKANPGSFNLVVTDMTMPNMTGVQLAAEIKKIRRDIPVILCTGFSYQINDEKSKALGIQGFVMKPVIMKEFAATIRKVLDNSEEG